MKVKIDTSFGVITVRLYDETPLHRDNFVKLAKEGYFDGMLFHRVIRDFMIQGGDPDSKTASPGQSLGTGGPGYTIEAEIRKDLFHKRGALAAARQGDQVNPQRRSSGSQFYIVWGQIYKEGQLRQLSKQMEMQQMQQIFDTLAMEHRDEVLRLRKERRRVDTSLRLLDPDDFRLGAELCLDRLRICLVFVSRLLMVRRQQTDHFKVLAF